MIRRNKEQWLSLFQQYTDSGLTAVEFCKRHDVDQAYFSLRKKQLLSPGAETTFVPVARFKKDVATSNVKMQCRFESCVVQFESLPDVTWLGQLIKALS
jgi:hypothetical protein